MHLNKIYSLGNKGGGEISKEEKAFSRELVISTAHRGQLWSRGG